MPDPASYGDTWAAIYDEVHPVDPAATVELLVQLAGWRVSIYERAS
jgi:hypothetical protein